MKSRKGVLYYTQDGNGGWTTHRTPPPQVAGNMKADGAKAPMGDLPLAALQVVSRVFGHGNAKYSLDNWMSNETANLRRYAAACMRHLTARQGGEILDPDSGLPHLAHAVASLLIALHHETQTARDGLWR